MDGGLRVASTLDANGSAEPFFFWLRISLWAERDVRDVSVWTLAGALLMALGWFLANTYPPWLSAWLEAAALASAVVFSGAAWHLARGRLTPTTFTLSTPLVALTLLTLGSLVLQCVAGVMLFTGDAMMVVAYLLAWMLAMHAGHVIAMASTPHNLDVFWFTLLVSAIAAIGLALVQWLNVSGLGIFVLDMRAGGRPYANLGQPNNFCTLCFLGCAGALYFYERGKLCGAAFWFVWSWLCFGMALSQSRTGWLQMASLVVGLWWAGRKISLRMGGVKIFSLGASFAVLVLILPELAHALGITVGRTLGEQMHGGVRMQYWLSMLHAVTQRPWLGYGWLQTGLAQQLEASSNLHRGIFDFAHNIVLDVVLWTGLPLGLIIVLCSGGWMLQTARSLSSGTGIAAMLALSGVLIHALVEYPLAYAYFLVPVGFFMGMLQSTCASKAGWSMGRRLMAVCALSAA
ncbi:MAG: O-antigen ligase C-terminal domain-containing protein, partial [Caldilineaceae bacterium]|nr:O-antigen ligase C-terminal domain-containing protein [Caldilineaceae bacterium]